MTSLSDDYLDIPDFLKRTPGVATASPVVTTRAKSTPQRQPRQRRWHGVALPKSIEPAGIEILKQMKRDEERKKKGRLAALRELKLSRR